jgi:crotonobetainyl-CoA:carnitine CoA-transferase CaiB-like acyl-CoA transferase
LSELVVSTYSYRGASPEPVGNGIPGLAPFGTIYVKDGVIAIAAPHDPQFKLLCQLIGQPELMDDPRFSKEALRWENHVALREAIERFTMTKTKAELKELFGGKVPFSPIYNAAEIFDDPHFTVREMLPQVEHPGSATPVCVPGIPVKLSDTPGQVRHRAPLLGEHSRSILAEVGLDATRIQALIDSGVVSAQ